MECEIIRLTLSESDLAGQESTSVRGSGTSVKEGVDVNTNNIHSSAKVGSTVRLEDVQGLSGSDRAAVTSVLEFGANAGHVAGQLGCGTVPVEDSLVTNDHQDNHVPLAPGDDILNLVGASGATASLEKNAKNQSKAVLLSRSTNILETGAVGGVDTDVLESLGGN